MDSRKAMFVRAQAEQDQLWVGMDDWYEDADKEIMLPLIELLDSGGECEPEKLRSLPDLELLTIGKLALNMLRELAIRNETRR